MNQDSPPPSYYEAPCLTEDQERMFDDWDTERQQAESIVLSLIDDQWGLQPNDVALFGPDEPSMEDLLGSNGPRTFDWAVAADGFTLQIVPDDFQIRFVSCLKGIEEITHD